MNKLEIHKIKLLNDLLAKEVKTFEECVKDFQNMIKEFDL